MMEQSLTKLSIITINYNNGEGLKKTIESVVTQTFKSFEYIVIDGDSNDGSKNIISQYSGQINYWVSEKDNGIYKAMNKGIEKAKGEYLLFLNSGDYLLHPDVLNIVFSKNKSADILYANLQTEDRVLSYPAKLNFTYFFRDSIGHPAAFIKRHLFEKLGNYNEDNKIISDWEFFFKAIVINKASYKHIDETITYYDSKGMSNNPENVSKQLDERIKVLSPWFTEYYPELLFEFDELQKELNRYKNSRAVNILISIMNSKLYRLLKK